MGTRRSPLRSLAAGALVLALLLPSAAMPAASASPPLSAPLLLMIAPDTFVDELVPLKAWRESQGFRVDVVTTTSIQTQYSGFDFGDEIHKFLVARKAADPSLEYVLLVADDPIIPGRLLQVANRTAGPAMADANRSVTSDFYYAVTGATFLDGADLGDEYPAGALWYGISDNTWSLTPDLHVGRIPATTESEVARYVSRLLAWEQSPPAGAWQSRALLGLG